MHKFPPGYLKKIGIGAAAVAVALVLILAMGFGGRPTAQEEANRGAQKLNDLYNKVHKK